MAKRVKKAVSRTTTAAADDQDGVEELLEQSHMEEDLTTALAQIHVVKMVMDGQIGERVGVSADTPFAEDKGAERLSWLLQKSLQRLEDLDVIGAVLCKHFPR